MEFSQLARRLARRLFPEVKEESLSSLLCNEQLSNVHPSAITDSHVDSPKDGKANIIADSQANDEDYLWKSRRYGNQWRLREVSRLIVDSSCDEENVGSNIPEIVVHTDSFSTPESKKVHVNGESGASSRPGTPFRSGLKAAVVASSIFDAIKSEEKKKKQQQQQQEQLQEQQQESNGNGSESRNSHSNSNTNTNININTNTNSNTNNGTASSSSYSPEKKKAMKKGMVASRDILSYFSPKKVESKWSVCEQIRYNSITFSGITFMSWTVMASNRRIFAERMNF